MIGERIFASPTLRALLLLMAFSAVLHPGLSLCASPVQAPIREGERESLEGQDSGIVPGGEAATSADPASSDTSPRDPPSPEAGEDPALAEAVAKMTDILDIRPPEPYGWDPRWRLGIVAALLLAAVTALLWFLRRRRQIPGDETTVSPAPSDETALAELASLANGQGVSDKAFYFRLSAILRAYVDARFGLDTMERTTEELLPAVRQLPVEAAVRSALVELFRFADPVKYADAAAGGDARAAHLTAAEAFVRATRHSAEASDV